MLAAFKVSSSEKRLGAAGCIMAIALQQPRSKNVPRLFTRHTCCSDGMKVRVVRRVALFEMRIGYSPDHMQPPL